MQKVSVVWLLATIIALIQGCAQTPKHKTLADLGPELAQAAQMEAAGEFRAASTLYRQLAVKISPPQSQALLLKAAENLLLAGEAPAALALLSGIDAREFSSNDKFRKHLLSGEAALATGDYNQALLLLTPYAPTNQTPDDPHLRYRAARAEALLRMGNNLESAGELSKMDPLLTDPQQRLDNQSAVFNRLSAVNAPMLRQLQPTSPVTFAGWIDLVLLLKTPDENQEGIETRLENWHQSYPEHPALPEFLDLFLQTREARYQKLATIGVLLPESGKYAKVAEALRHGLMAAYFNQPAEHRPVLHFFDSSDPADTWPLYQQAIEAGADFVLGPLNKQAVEQLATAGDLKVPVLALNWIALDSLLPEDLFQFGLIPEDEARQAAEKAWSDGYVQALVLTPEGSWGTRIFEAFSERWASLGGQLLEHQVYDAKANDFSDPIRKLLNLDESGQRRLKLERTVRKKVKFEPRRRQDVDFIFLAAHTQKARQIRPQLAFHFAADLPIYTTSHAFTGIPDPARDQDINGLEFPDIPWLLADDSTTPLSREIFFRALPQSNTRYSRYYAMGVDAFNILHQLLYLSNNPEQLYDGKTGALYLDARNRVHRQLIWARIKQGIPQIIGYAPRIPVSPPPIVGGDSETLDDTPLNKVDIKSMENESPAPALELETGISLPISR